MSQPTDDEIRSFCLAHQPAMQAGVGSVFTDLFNFAKTLISNGVSWDAVKKLITDVSEMFKTGKYDYALILADVLALFSKTPAPDVRVP